MILPVALHTLWTFGKSLAGRGEVNQALANAKKQTDELEISTTNVGYAASTAADTFFIPAFNQMIETAKLGNQQVLSNLASWNQLNASPPTITKTIEYNIVTRGRAPRDAGDFRTWNTQDLKNTGIYGAATNGVQTPSYY